MKILHVVQGYYPTIGGTEWLVQRVSEELVSQFGDKVSVFTTSCYNAEGFSNPRLPHFQEGWQDVNGIPVYRFPVLSRVSKSLWWLQKVAYLNNLPFNEQLRSWAHGPLVPGLRSAIRKFPCDVIAASSFPLLHMFDSQIAAQESGRPSVLIGALHPDDHWSFERQRIYKTIQRANAYIGYTKFEADYVIKRGADPFRVHTVGLGVDPEPFRKILTQEARQKFGIGEGPLVGYIGQLAAHKMDMLVNAMPLVWEVMPEVRLLLAGSKTSYVEKMEKIIAEWPEDHRQKTTLIFNYKEVDKPWLFSAIDVLAYPSAWESFGIAYLEAWAAGKPVIGCARGAVPWVIDSGHDGLLVDYQNHDMLAEAIIMLLRNSEWREALGAAGRKKVLERYTWKQVGKRFRDIYQLVYQENVSPH